MEKVFWASPAGAEDELLVQWGAEAAAGVCVEVCGVCVGVCGACVGVCGACVEVDSVGVEREVIHSGNSMSERRGAS